MPVEAIAWDVVGVAIQMISAPRRATRAASKPPTAPGPRRPIRSSVTRVLLCLCLRRTRPKTWLAIALVVRQPAAQSTCECRKLPGKLLEWAAADTMLPLQSLSLQFSETLDGLQSIKRCPFGRVQCRITYSISDLVLARLNRDLELRRTALPRD